MVNETITARLGTEHPEQNPALAGCCPPPEGARARELVDERGRPLLPRVVRALRRAMAKPATAAAPAAELQDRVQVSEYYPPVDPSLLGMYMARGMELRTQATAETLLAGAHAVARGASWFTGAARRRPADAAVESTAASRTRSVLDAGDTYPAVDPFLLATYMDQGRRLQGQATADLLLAGARGLIHGFSAVLGAIGRWLRATPAERTAVTDLERLQALAHRGALDIPPDYEQRRARFYGRGL